MFITVTQNTTTSKESACKIICHKDAGEWRHDGGIALLHFQKGDNGGGGAFSQQHHRYFHGWTRSTWNKFVAAVRTPRKLRMIFYNFCYYFWGQHCWWKETITVGNDFLFFISSHCPHLFTTHLPYRGSGVPEYSCRVVKLPQNVGLQTQIWRRIVTSQTAYIQQQWPR